MSFYMNMGILNEGEQAEAYKKRKEEEKLAKEKAEKDHHNKRYPGFRGDDSYLRKPAGSQNPSNKDRNLFFVDNHPEIYKKDNERSQKVDNILDKEESRRKKNMIKLLMIIIMQKVKILIKNLYCLEDLDGTKKIKR